MQTELTKLLGIKYPILCGGMLWLSEPNLCAAISNAGGLGNITAANYNSGEELREAIKKTRELTDKPFGVNVTLLPSFRITEQMYDDYFRVCAEEHVAGMEISGAPAVKYMNMMHDAGVVMMHKVGSIKHAKHIEEVGYDAVMSVGYEAGGHPLDDNVTSMVLTPLMCEAVKIPVIAVGGMANGKSLAAALSLGASGIMMASRFIATKECIAHMDAKQRLVDSREMDTKIICQSIKLQGRALVNENVKKILELEAANAPADQIFPLITGAKSKIAWEAGNMEDATFMVGESIGLINDVPTCKELLDGIATTAEQIIRANVKYFD